MLEHERIKNKKQTLKRLVLNCLLLNYRKKSQLASKYYLISFLFVKGTMATRLPCLDLGNSNKNTSEKIPITKPAKPIVNITFFIIIILCLEFPVTYDNYVGIFKATILHSYFKSDIY